MAEIGDRKLSIEVKSLNSKQMTGAELPSMFRDKEVE